MFGFVCFGLLLTSSLTLCFFSLNQKIKPRDQLKEPFGLKVVSVADRTAGLSRCYGPEHVGVRPCQTSALLSGELPSAFLDCFFPLLLLLLSALFIVEDEERSVGSGANAGSPSAAETVDAGLLSEMFLPGRRGGAQLAPCAVKWQLTSRLFRGLDQESSRLCCSGPVCVFLQTSPRLLLPLTGIPLQFWLHLSLML